MSTVRVIRRHTGELPEGLRGLHPLLARIYAAREVRDAAELDSALSGLAGVETLSGMGAAVDLLEDCLVHQRRILIVGDFDADGATSTALAMRALLALGAGAVDYLVPNRFEYGYGLTPEIVAVAATRSPAVILTVDNGVSSIEGVEAAQAAGIQVLVTDHHLPGRTLPRADAMVNPNLPGDAFPSKAMAGVGVIFYVMLALRTRLREQGWFERQGLPEPNMAQWLDLVALGTVADVVPLDRNNRILVAQGLQRMRAGRCVPGISALLKVAGRDPSRLVAADLGFAVGPRLNAAGRLEDMSLGIECLLCDDPEQARLLAARLDTLNQERKVIEQDMKTQALAEVERLQGRLKQQALPKGLALYDEGWHQGVIGILAARIRERFHRPVIAFAPADSETLKGSARSVPGLHIRDVLDGIAARHPGLITKFGGHAMAAGLSLPGEHFERFRAAFDAHVGELLDEQDLQGVIYSEGALEAEEINLDVARLIRAGGPWGQGFPEPLFDGEFDILNRRIVGERHLKLTLRPASGAAAIDAIAFNIHPEDWPDSLTRIHIAYRLDVNEYQGRQSAQLIVEQAPIRSA